MFSNIDGKQLLSRVRSAAMTTLDKTGHGNLVVHMDVYTNLAGRIPGWEDGCLLSLLAGMSPVVLWCLWPESTGYGASYIVRHFPTQLNLILGEHFDGSPECQTRLTDEGVYTVDFGSVGIVTLYPLEVWHKAWPDAVEVVMDTVPLVTAPITIPDPRRGTVGCIPCMVKRLHPYGWDTVFDMLLSSCSDKPWMVECAAMTTLVSKARRPETHGHQATQTDLSETE